MRDFPFEAYEKDRDFECTTWTRRLALINDELFP